MENYENLLFRKNTEDEEYFFHYDEKYELYSNYSDDKISAIDEDGHIRIHPSHTAIAQGANSQYIPFRIKRYWDGIDLINMLIQIHYHNPQEKGGDVVNAVNVIYNDEAILFGWLIDSNVTAAAGNVIFEITATGLNEKNDPYIWKTFPDGKITVVAGIGYGNVIENEENWYTSLRNMLESHIESSDGNLQSLQKNIDTKLDKNDPIATGTVSQNRKPGTAIGKFSSTNGKDCTASGNYSHVGGTDSESVSEGQFLHGTNLLGGVFKEEPGKGIGYFDIVRKAPVFLNLQQQLLPFHLLIPYILNGTEHGQNVTG